MTETERKKLLRAIRQKGVILAGTPPDLREPDFTVTKVGLIDDSFALCWQTASAGFGEVTFQRDGDRIVCDNEAMSRAFLKEVLCKLVDTAVMVDKLGEN